MLYYKDIKEDYEIFSDSDFEEYIFIDTEMFFSFIKKEK